MSVDKETIWLIIGFVGQALFSARFIVQWIKSEREKKSVFPIAFWYFSIAGGLTLSAYAIYRQDPVFIVGQLSGLFIYFRNLYFVVYERKNLKID
ncbi:MAG: lipid-A-disaccharide synthase N-terminal domain-containing protein [Methylococcaceae bacterium]|nr:lipid-A-disaccharide synthase N-terminal domain-containing protein [Methylococcales bacterium]MDO9164206.1 lipid-A-disaccharide synthase N-terminal domain-containing protein [Methylococcaceae bacterium]PPD51131.1 MAG: lipid A biosynthesis protein [Methylobacter sp.]MDP2395171.1 lipid-A-disaccharide synthase N-terminal domain-containing protein [Methylococcaceae bacterium]MDP3018687.1 lipid-A-disaccharide synthase N-terminal domain-containing protein [Methylococcaceae bacterium]